MADRGEPGREGDEAYKRTIYMLVGMFPEGIPRLEGVDSISHQLHVGPTFSEQLLSHKLLHTSRTPMLKTQLQSC